MDQPLWRPNPEQAAASQMAAFKERFAGRLGRELADYQALFQASIDERAAFWAELWDSAGVIASKKADTVLQNGDAMPGAHWFEGARLNFAENLLRRRDDGLALIAHKETGERRTWSFEELHQDCCRFQKALVDLGVGPGDRVAAMVPNAPEAIIAMLAATSLGAIWSSCSPDFGVQGVLDRFGQIEPKVLVTVDGYAYGGKRIDIRKKVAAVAQALPTLEAVIVAPFLDEEPDLAGIAKAASTKELLPATAPDMDFRQLPFDHPLYVLYSSGTTGVPKAICHGAGGTLLQHLKEHRLHGDIKAGDRLFYFTTCGWMMWNWLVSGLAAEATLVLFDGNPFHPGPERLFDLAEAEGMTVFGTSAKYIDAVKKSGFRPKDKNDLSALRAMLSTGSPLLPESFDFVYEAIKEDLLLGSISGGTDIVSCFVLCNPLLPVHRGEIQCRGLGLAVDVLDDEGRPVRGDRGELVCTRPFPAMPIKFWNDADGSRYHDAYFARFPGIWCHGDFAEITEHGGIVIHGRSDAVLNPGGVRIGTAEIYRQVEQIDEVLESICIGQDWQGDVRVVLFVRLREGSVLDDALGTRIKKRIRAHASPRHVPARILQVADIPRTLSGKIVELAVRDVVHKRPVKNTEALANPEALELFRDRPELAT